MGRKKRDKAAAREAHRHAVALDHKMRGRYKPPFMLRLLGWLLPGLVTRHRERWESEHQKNLHRAEKKLRKRLQTISQ